MNDRCVDDRATADRDAAVGQIAVDLGEELLAQIVLLDQVPELADRRLVGNAAFAQIDPRKRPHRDHIVERFLNGWIAQG